MPTHHRRLSRAITVAVLLAIGCVRRPPPHSVDSARQLEQVGVAAYRKGDYTEAREHVRAARTILEERGARDLFYATVLQDLAEYDRVLGDARDAQPLLVQVLAIREEQLPPGHPEIGRTLSNMGLVLSDIGNHAEAEDAYRRAIANLEASLGPDHVDVGTPLANLSGLLRRVHRCTEAEAVGRRSLAIREGHLPATHPDIGRSLAAVAHAIGCDPARYTEAETLYVRMVAAWEQSLGPEHPQLALGLADWADDAAAANRLDVAEGLYARALRIQEARLPPQHPALARTRRRYAEVHARVRKTGIEAETVGRSAE